MRLLLATLLAGIGLHAATITLGPIAQPGGYNLGDQTSFNTNILLPQFNAGLGTLTGVEITVDTQINKDGSLVNNGSNAAPVSYNYTLATISVTGEGVNHSQSASGTFTVGETFLNVAGGGGSVPISSLQEFDLGNIFNPGNLSAFIGGGTIAYAVNGSAILNTGCGSGNCATLINTRMGAQISVTYTYEPDTNEIPEPASFALVGLGVLALGLVGRRRLNVTRG
ncbi:MAG: PEP-CTERM sorting domain-containing protein [Bryobacterales bacterium]|nr:PEP-CTERM sorting domain-containing protein [Bryobacterales bacterium]